MKIGYFLSAITDRSGRTAERPQSLKNDSLARYDYAKKYCKGKSVLDVGTGFGFGAEFIAKEGAKKVLGIDYDLGVIKRASRLRKPKNVSFKYLDAIALGDLNEKFDVILAFEVIEHIPIKRAREFIFLLYDHLKPGGTLLLSTPNGRKSKYFLGSLYNPYHQKEYKKGEIDELLSECFSEVRTIGYGLTNRQYLKKDFEISRSPLHRLSYILGHFKVVRELVAFIPENIKHLVTKENELPLLGERDYKFEANVDRYDGLFVMARNKNVSSRRPLISIVIANYNGESYLKGCLDSVLVSDYDNFEVVICDDASTDNSLDIIRRYESKNHRIKVIRNNKNLGASASRNKAVKKTSGEIIVFLDNDTEVERKWLSAFADLFLKDVRLGAAQALLLDLNKSDLVQHAGGVLIPSTGWSIPFFQWSRYRSVKNKIRGMNVMAVSAALAVRRIVFDRVGGFDEKESVHSEDLDFSWRVWIAGYRVFLANKAIVYHLAKSVSGRSHMGSNNFKIYFHLAKNSFRSFIKNYELVNVVKFLPQAIIINFVRGLLVLARRRDPSAFLATINAVFWNIVNLSNTINQREMVQKTRFLSDRQIMAKIFDKRGLFKIYNQNFRQTKLLW